MANLSEAGKKGGAKTIELGKGSFGDTKERLKSASKGGKTQGKRNADSGHLKRIAQLPNTRSKGKIWITNGTQNKMINPTDNMPEGFRKGKVQK
jgi:general stress protein YciG